MTMNIYDITFHGDHVQCRIVALRVKAISGSLPIEHDGEKIKYIIQRTILPQSLTQSRAGREDSGGLTIYACLLIKNSTRGLLYKEPPRAALACR